MRLIETGDLLPLFERRVLSSKKIDIASAWATPSKALNVLINASRGQQVRSLIGISGLRHGSGLRSMNWRRLENCVFLRGLACFIPSCTCFTEMRVHTPGSVARTLPSRAASDKEAAGIPAVTRRSCSKHATLKPPQSGLSRRGTMAAKCGRVNLRSYREEWSRNPPSWELNRMVAGPRLGSWGSPQISGRSERLARISWKPWTSATIGGATALKAEFAVHDDKRQLGPNDSPAASHSSEKKIGQTYRMKNAVDCWACTMTRVDGRFWAICSGAGTACSTFLNDAEMRGKNRGHRRTRCRCARATVPRMRSRSIDRIDRTAICWLWKGSGHAIARARSSRQVCVGQ